MESIYWFCFQANKSNDEDSIFIVNVQQYSLYPDKKDSGKHVYIVYFSRIRKFWRREKRDFLWVSQSLLSLNIRHRNPWYIVLCTLFSEFIGQRIVCTLAFPVNRCWCAIHVHICQCLKFCVLLIFKKNIKHRIKFITNKRI